MYLNTASSRLVFLGIGVTLLASMTSFAQGPGGRRGPRIKPALVPFALVKKQAGFDALLPNMSQFNEMQALRAVLTPAVVPGLKQAVPALQLNYGYKKGGIGVVYEMPKQPGLDPDQVFQGLLKSRVFADRQYFKGWSIKAVPDSKLLIAVSGTTPEVRDALIRAIGK